MTDFSMLNTPCLILDKTILNRNLNRMRSHMAQNGVQLRPHIKTCKSARIADLATGGTKSGLTVSTLKEAEYFFQYGYQDIQYAVGFSPDKLSRAAALIQKGARLQVITDSLEMAQIFAATPLSLKVLIEIDSGGGRGGLRPGDEKIQQIAACLGDKFYGLLTHAGHSYGGESIEQIADIAEQERLAVVEIARQLKQAGHQQIFVSLGSTPTAIHARNFEGVNEVRAGVYMVNDLFQFGRQTCQREDLALTVLTTVIGHKVKDHPYLLVDAGALALSQDRSVSSLWPDQGYAAVCQAHDMSPIPGFAVTQLYQEHGMVRVPDADILAQYPVGTRLRILPAHACMTAAAYPGYHILEDGHITDYWERMNGW